MTNNKLRIHIKNNHASSKTFPPTIEGEEVFTITEANFQVACQRFPAVAEQVEAFIDWDLEHFAESMEPPMFLSHGISRPQTSPKSRHD